MKEFDWDEAEKELKKPLSADAVKPPPKGKFGEYVDGLHVISEANRIFGHGGWSYEITRLEMVSELTCETQRGPQYRCGWMCTVKATAGGVYREGAAVGMGNGKPDNMADVIESAVKEAETDALKRALRSLGNTFGLALYEKDAAKRQVERPLSTREKVDAAETVEEINSLMDECAKLGNEAKKHLAYRAKTIGAAFDKEAGKFVKAEGGDQ